MAKTIILGAGVNGLTTAMLLARDGHEVTVLERDAAEPPAAGDAWEAWGRRGVSQFRLPHFSLSRWHGQMAAELPEVLDELLKAGGFACNMLGLLPQARWGEMRPRDKRFDTITARRPLLEAVLAKAAAGTAGLTIRRGVAVTGFRADSSENGHPRVTGVLTEGGQAIPADLVIDCCGRRSALGSWLEAIGARRPAEQVEDCGFVYFARHFRGEMPKATMNIVQHYDSVTLLTLPGDSGTWSVTFTISSKDKALRALRAPTAFEKALTLYPHSAHWLKGEPITGVEAIAGIEDRHRRLAIDGVPVATGVVAVGDAWACTNPSLGRGTSIGLLHARGLRDLLREVDAGDHEKLARRFDEVTVETVEPLYRQTLWFDRHRLAEIDADIAGIPYRPGDPAWSAAKALFAASLSDPEACRAYQGIVSLIETPEGAAPPVVDVPAYPVPGPRRAELLAALAG